MDIFGSGIGDIVVFCVVDGGDVLVRGEDDVGGYGGFEGMVEVGEVFYVKYMYLNIIIRMWLLEKDMLKWFILLMNNILGISFVIFCLIYWFIILLIFFFNLFVIFVLLFFIS